jgi:hypothetical protein
MRGVAEFLGFVGAVILVIASLFSVIMLLFAGPMWYLGERSCKNNSLGLEWNYKLLGDDCLVKIPSGQYVNIDTVRITQQGKILVNP